MNKSLEALNKLTNMIDTYNIHDRLEFVENTKAKKVNELYNTIKQDLEKLELIEALYNKSLKEMENIKDVDRELYLKYKALKDLEYELGCPLEIVFKALKDGYVIFKNKVGIENPEIILERHKVLGLRTCGGDFALLLEDFVDNFYVLTNEYGKYWLLKGDKLE